MTLIADGGNGFPLPELENTPEVAGPSAMVTSTIVAVESPAPATTKTWFQGMSGAGWIIGGLIVLSIVIALVKRFWKK